MNQEWIRVRAYNPWWCSHLPILTKVMQVSKGPVLEMGIGIFSTPLLHMFCQDQKRKLFSYEDNQKWYAAHKEFITDWHKIELVTDWSKVKMKKHWGVVFIDHKGDRRAKDAIRAAKVADYVVLHDSNGRYEPDYHYSKVYSHFKYRYIYDKIHPHTTVLSNFFNVSLW